MAAAAPQTRLPAPSHMAAAHELSGPTGKAEKVGATPPVVVLGPPKPRGSSGTLEQQDGQSHRGHTMQGGPVTSIGSMRDQLT